MLSMRTAALAIAFAAIVPIAYAQDASTASGKRVSIVGGVTQLQPTNNAWMGDTQRFKANGSVAPTLGVTYHINDNLGIEAWGAADKYSHRITGNEGQSKLGRAESQPYAVSAQYQFGPADQILRPFVGLGYYEQNFSNESTDPNGPYAGSRLGIETATGPMATLGVDANIDERWFARADARYLYSSSEEGGLKVDGAGAADTEFSPVMVGVGLGVKY